MDWNINQLAEFCRCFTDLLAVWQEVQTLINLVWVYTACLKIFLLILKAPNKKCSRRHFNFDILLLFFKENKAWCIKWILCLAEDSLETSSHILFWKTMKKYLWMSSAAVVIGTLRVNMQHFYDKYLTVWDNWSNTGWGTFLIDAWVEMYVTLACGYSRQWSSVGQYI